MLASLLNMVKTLAGLYKYVPLAFSAVSVILGTIRRIKYMSNETGNADIKALADKLIADLSAAKAELVESKLSIRDAIKNIPDVVYAVEAVSATIKLASDQKRELAVEVINRFINVPLIPESGEAVLIGFVVDAVVAAFNKYGKDWFNKVLPVK